LDGTQIPRPFIGGSACVFIAGAEFERDQFMRGKAIIASALAGALLAASASEASARWVRGPGPVLGLFGAVGALVVGAATIATAPIAIVARAARYAPRPRPYYYPAPPPANYYYAPPPPAAYAPPPANYYYAPPPRPAYAPPMPAPSYDYPQPDPYGPPPGY